MLALAACQRQAQLSVSQGSGEVTVTATSEDKPACVRDLYVYESGKGGVPLWHVATASIATCTHMVSLGRVPEGFAADTGRPNLTLKPGTSYDVEMSGSGMTGATTFVAQTSPPWSPAIVLAHHGL